MTDPNQKPLIHFAHANGVPSRAYQKLFDLLSDECDVVYVPVLAAHKGYAVDAGWHSITEQVAASIRAQAGGRKVVGLGHSLGGLSTFFASYRYPELFHQVVMMDPPMILGKAALMFQLASWFSPKTVDKMTPAGKSLGRRDVWDTRDEAYEQLCHKSLFKNFDKDCFADYIKHGLIDTPDGKVTLTIPVASEVGVFRTNPPNFWLHTPKPKVPVHQISGASSQFLAHGFPQMLQKSAGVDFTVTDGSHMFPLEHPKAVVQLIKSLIVK